MSVGAGSGLEQALRRRVDVAGVGQERLLEALRLRGDAVLGADPRDRGVEVVEDLVLDPRDDLVDEAAGRAPPGTPPRSGPSCGPRRARCRCRAGRGCAGRRPRPTGRPRPPAARPRRGSPTTAGPQLTSVTSPPSRTTLATPIGTRCSPSGTRPLAVYRPWLSTNMTGLLVRIADFSSPLASAGFDG